MLLRRTFLSRARFLYVLTSEKLTLPKWAEEVNTNGWLCHHVLCHIMMSDVQNSSGTEQDNEPTLDVELLKETARKALIDTLNAVRPLVLINLTSN